MGSRTHFRGENTWPLKVFPTKHDSQIVLVPGQVTLYICLAVMLCLSDNDRFNDAVVGWVSSLNEESIFMVDPADSSVVEMFGDLGWRLSQKMFGIFWPSLQNPHFGRYQMGPEPSL